MEKKQKTRLAERIVETFGKAEREDARTKVIDLGQFIRKKSKIMN